MITVFSLLSGTKPNERIVIEHIGESDKPIRTIIISTKSARESNTDTFIVSAKIYAKMKTVIEIAKPSINSENTEYGSFKFKNDATEKCYGRKESIILINTLVKSLYADDNELERQLKIILSRISF